MKLKNKSMFAILAVFLLAMSVAAIYAETATVGSLSFEVPDDLTVASTTDSELTLKNSDGDEIVIDDTLDSKNAASDYLGSHGYSYDSSFTVDRTSYGADGSPGTSYSYTIDQYSGNGYAFLYSFDVDGEEHTIIAYTDSLDDASASMMIEGVDGVDDLMDAIMQ